MINMEKLLTMDFALVLFIVMILFVAHEYGHYLAYRILKIPAKLRRSIIAPGIDPKERVLVKWWQGLMIAFAGSIVDFIWAISMVGKRNITINSKNMRKSN